MKSGRLKGILVMLILTILIYKSQSTGSNDKEDVDEEEEYIRDLAERTSEANRKGMTLKEMERLPSKQRIIGVEGVNYEMNGTEPYLTCQYLNRTECDPAVRSDCPKTVNCYLDGSQRQIACIGVFYFEHHDSKVNTTSEYLNVSDSETLILGCFSLSGDVNEEFCHEETCRAREKRLVAAPKPDRKKRRAEKSGYGYCCCHRKNCNKLGEIEMKNPYYVDVNATDDIEQNTQSATTPSINESDMGLAAKNMVGLMALVFGSVCAVALVVAVVAVRRKYRLVKTHDTLVLPDDGGADNNGGMSMLRMDDLMANSTPVPLIASDIHNLQLLAHGRFGKVYRGIRRMPNGEETLVAVKKHTLSDQRSYLAEKEVFETFLKLDKWYPSIVRYIGAVSLSTELWIVTEFHERLSLFDMLKSCSISLSTASRLITSMADGLQFMHDAIPFYVRKSKPCVIHRDLKSKNILIKNDLTACIADFGLARKFEENSQKKNDLLGQVGTRRYMSPEVLEGATEFTPAAFKQMDIYAMALVFWEVISRIQFDETDQVPPYRLPYEEEVGVNPQIGLMRNVVVVKRIRPKFRQQILKFEYTQRMEKVIQEMWDAESCGRITASCAFERIWKAVVECQKEFKEFVVTLDSISKYHDSNVALPHPTPDPYKDLPPPPMIPQFQELQEPGAVGYISPIMANDSEGQISNIYDMELRRFITDAEARQIDAEGGRRSGESTATPEWSMC